MLTRAGTTLAELLVGVVLAGIVLATATRTVMVQQRTATSLSVGSAFDAQRRAARGAIAADLGAASVGELVPSESSDTTVQLRGLVAVGMACTRTVGAALLPGADTDDATSPSSMLSPPRAGDTLWWRAEEGQGWRAARIAAAGEEQLACGAGARARSGYRATLGTLDTVPPGAPLRVTRQIRYVVYRSSGSGWQLGLREWSAATGAMAGPQPLAGPFERPATAPRTGFRYLDATGGNASPGAAARVRVTLVWRDVAARVPSPLHADSIDVALGGGAP